MLIYIYCACTAAVLFRSFPASTSTVSTIFDSSPVLSADESTVYATSHLEGVVRAFNVGGTDDDNRVVWEFGPEDVAGILKASADNNPGGQEIQSRAIYSSPVLSPDGETIYFVGYSAFLIALDATNGELRWISSEHNYILGNTVDVAASPVLSNDPEGRVLYLGTEMGLAAYNADDGSRIWIDELYMPRVYHGLRVTTAAVYGVGDDAIVFFGRGDFVYAFTAAAGVRIGRFKTDAEVYFASLHPRKPILYVGGRDRQLRSVRFNTTGEAATETKSCYVEDSGLKVCSTSDCKQCRLGIFAGTDEDDVEYDWAFLTGGEVASPPAQSDDGLLLYFGSFDQHIYAVQSGDATTTTTTTTVSTTTTTTATTTTTTTTTTTSVSTTTVTTSTTTVSTTTTTSATTTTTTETSSTTSITTTTTTTVTISTTTTATKSSTTTVTTRTTTTPAEASKASTNYTMEIAVGAGCLFLLVLGGAIFYCKRQKQSHALGKSGPPAQPRRSVMTLLPEPPNQEQLYGEIKTFEVDANGVKETKLRHESVDTAEEIYGNAARSSSGTATGAVVAAGAIEPDTIVYSGTTDQEGGGNAESESNAPLYSVVNRARGSTKGAENNGTSDHDKGYLELSEAESESEEEQYDVKDEEDGSDDDSQQLTVYPTSSDSNADRRVRRYESTTDGVHVSEAEAEAALRSALDEDFEFADRARGSYVLNLEDAADEDQGINDV